MQNEPMEVTVKVTTVLERLGIPYLIAGSLASTLYGLVRTTQDSDIITEIHFEHIRPFIAALQDEFFVDEEMIVEAVRRNSSFNMIHRFAVRAWLPGMVGNGEQRQSCPCLDAYGLEDGCGPFL